MKVRFKIAVIWGMILCCYFSAAQENEWSGLENAGVHTGARSSALGGANGADTEAELTDWYVNPASLNRGSWSNIALHSAFFPGDIQAFSLMGLIPLTHCGLLELVFPTILLAKIFDMIRKEIHKEYFPPLLQDLIWVLRGF